jgi:hypothetical protein
MFRAPLCSSSGKSILLIRHLVYVTLCRWPSSVQVWMEWHIPNVVLIKLILLMMSKEVLETCKESEKICTKKEFCVKLVIYKKWNIYIYSKIQADFPSEFTWFNHMNFIIPHEANDYFITITSMNNFIINHEQVTPSLIRIIRNCDSFPELQTGQHLVLFIHIMVAMCEQFRIITDGL